MPVSYLKSDGYSRFLRDAAVPSTPVCCFIIFVILKYYKNIYGIYGTVFSITFFILFIITLLLTAFRYKKIFYSRKLIIIYTPFMVLTIIAITFFLKNKILSLTSDSELPEYIENITVLIDDITIKRYSSDLYFHTTGHSVSDVTGIIYYQGESFFNKGDSLFLHKKINKVAINNKGFNKYLISQGIHYTAAVTDNDITVLKKNSPPLQSYFQKGLLNRIDSLFKPPASGVIKALLTGNQNYIEKKIILLFRDSAVLHCLSASGLHVALIAAIPAFLLIPFIRKKHAMSLSLLAVLLYLFITDMPVSLVRAVLMYGLFYFQLILYRNRNVFNYLMLTCSIILLISPWEIFSPGFQLSFAATAGILIFYKQYRQSLNNLPAVIADTTAVTISAQITTLPIILFHMNQLNTAGLLSNIIIIPLITLIMGIALFSILLSFFSTPAALLSGGISEQLLKLSLVITNFFTELRLNFNVYYLSPLLIIIILISGVPLIKSVYLKKLKFYPVLISAILCTLYLKQDNLINDQSFVISNKNSKAEIIMEEKKQILKLNLEEDADTDVFISEIKGKNPDIKIIELTNSTDATLLASKKIMNDYIIDEYRFAEIPELNNLFKKIIFQLEKDNVIVRFKRNCIPE